MLDNNKKIERIIFLGLSLCIILLITFYIQNAGIHKRNSSAESEPARKDKNVIEAGFHVVHESRLVDESQKNNKKQNVSVANTATAAAPHHHLTGASLAASKKIDAILVKNHFTGVAFVVKNDAIILKKGYGVDSNAVVPIGSLEKSLTAVLVGKLLENNRLSFNTKLSEYYPSIPNAKKITIKHLLTMTSGLGIESNPKTDDPVDFFHESISLAKQVYTFGRGKYHAINYSILAGIVEKENGKPYNQQFESYFMDQMKMNFYTFDQFQKLPNRDWNEVLEKNDRKHPDWNAVKFNREIGTGGYFSSLDTLFHHYQLLLQNQYLPEEITQALMSLPGGNSNYSSGLYNCGSYYWGRGLIGGYETTISISKDGKSAVILAMDHFNYDKNKGAEDINNAIYEIVKDLKA